MSRCRYSRHHRLDPAEVVVGPWSEHTHSVILLHGTHEDHQQFAEMEKLVIQEAGARRVKGTEGIKYIFPCSPINQCGDTLWYDSLTEEDAPAMQCDNGVINLAQWEEQVKRINSIVKEEVEALGDSRRVILGGSSGGGTVAIHVAMMQPASLGALICLHTFPMRLTLGPLPLVPLCGEPDGTNLLKAHQGMPVLLYQSRRDDARVAELQERNFRLLECRGYAVTRRQNARGQHESDDREGNKQTARWVLDAFFPKKVKRGLCLRTCFVKQKKEYDFLKNY